MVPSYRFLIVLTLLVVIIHLTESQTNKKLSRTKTSYRSLRRSSSYRTSYRRTYVYTNQATSRTSLAWWQILLIVTGVIALIGGIVCTRYCIRWCNNREPESDMPGIHTTRDQIQLRNHKPVSNFSNHHPTPLPSQTGYMPPVAAADDIYPSMVHPPSYGNAVKLYEDQNDEGAIDIQQPDDKWEDDINFKKKDFGVI